MAHAPPTPQRQTEDALARDRAVMRGERWSCNRTSSLRSMGARSCGSAIQVWLRTPVGQPPRRGLAGKHRSPYCGLICLPASPKTGIDRAIWLALKPQLDGSGLNWLAVKEKPTLATLRRACRQGSMRGAPPGRCLPARFRAARDRRGCLPARADGRFGAPLVVSDDELFTAMLVGRRSSHILMARSDHRGCRRLEHAGGQAAQPAFGYAERSRVTSSSSDVLSAAWMRPTRSAWSIIWAASGSTS
jgi:hypothetical protein